MSVEFTFHEEQSQCKLSVERSENKCPRESEVPVEKVKKGRKPLPVATCAQMHFNLEAIEILIDQKLTLDSD